MPEATLSFPDHSDPEALERHARALEGHTLAERLCAEVCALLRDVTNDVNKGQFGTILERYYFGLEPNSRAEPDFAEAGVELKSCPLVQSGRSFSPKERLVLNIINYAMLRTEEWETSSFWKKNALLLLVFYVWAKDRPAIDNPVRFARLWHYAEADLAIIRKDWETIRDKVRAGLAHELSEGDTLYLGACRKGHREGPRAYMDGAPPAKQRAFSLKQKYLRALLHELEGRKALEDVVGSPMVTSAEEIERHGGFEALVKARFEPFIGMTATDMETALGLASGEGKGRFDRISRAVLGVKGKKIAEFEKADLTMRTVRLTPMGRPAEAVSFKAFKFVELLEEDWEESTLREQLEHRFLFVVFRCRTKKDPAPVLERVLFWTMPIADLEGPVREGWERARLRIAEDADTLLRASEGLVVHVRPHARDREDTFPMPSGRLAPKKSFWLNQEYLCHVLRG